MTKPDAQVHTPPDTTVQDICIARHNQFARGAVHQSLHDIGFYAAVARLRGDGCDLEIINFPRVG